MKRALLVVMLMLANLAGASEHPVTKIVGGDDASLDYPWMAGLHFYDAGSFAGAGGYDPEPFCGGSLIAASWVVTAAHCIAEPGQGGDPSLYSPAAESVTIRLDLPDLNDEPQYLVSALFVHPQYGIEKDHDSDIALIQLMSEASEKPISIADNRIIDQLESSTVLDDVVRIIGWGRYDDASFNPDNASNANQPDFLQEVDLDYLPFVNNRCRNAWNGRMTSNMVCAWEPNPPATAPFGQDTCFGDSGGPLMLPANTTLSSGTTTHDWLLGATSFGSTDCNSTSNPGVYTRLANFDSWIEQTTASQGDPLIDARADLNVPTTARPDQDFNVEVVVQNGSRENNADTPIMILTSEALSLNPVDGTGCVAIAQGWSCSLSSLIAGQQHNRSFTASWSGADEGTASVSVNVSADQDDYRIANNLKTTNTTITLLPDPVLEPFQVISNHNRVANVTIAAGNASAVNNASNAVLILDFPAELSVTDDAGCSVVSPTRLSCELGTLAASTSEQVGLLLEGNGTFAVTATLQNSNGDIVSGDTQRTLNITLKKKSSGGGSSPSFWILSGALLYLRRKFRSQSSS